MATSIEAVYSGDSSQVYPITSVEAVKVDSDSSLEPNDTTLDKYLLALEKKISDASGTSAVANSIQFKQAYLRADTRDVSTIKEKDESAWSSDFLLPTGSKPYIWKRTKITFKGASDSDGQTFYEIVLADISEISQTLYMSQANDKQPEIKYPQIAQQDTSGSLVNVDDTGASLDDIIKESNSTNATWSKLPSEISAANPYGFIAVRNRVNGVWSTFKVALNAKWAYDSKVTIKYTITTTSTAPTVSRTAQNPGSIWVDSNSSEFTGYLWMITATLSDNKYIADSSGNCWSNPQLISVVK